MDFQLNDEQQAIRDEVRRLCARFDDNYWREHDRDHKFPEEFFRAMAGAFLRTHPPKTPVLFAWGADFPGFLEGFPPVAQLPYLADVARLELALRESYHAADAAAIDPGALERDDLAECRLRLAPPTRLLASPYPIHTIWRANTDDTPAELHDRGEWVLVTRPGFDPQPTRLAPEAGRFVAALLSGKTLGAAIDAGRDGLDLAETLTLLIGQNAIAALAPGKELPQ